MDVNGLHDCFLRTLQADQKTRVDAEQQLKQAEKVVGFLGACMDILDNNDVSPVVKKSCCIYFKNRITRSWDTIDNDEKPIIRERIVPLIIKIDRSIRNQLIPVLSVLVTYDYPSNWPEFLPSVVNLFQDLNDIRSLYAGALCFSEISRHYRWKQNDARSAELDPIIKQYFPSLVEVAKQFVANPNSFKDHYEAGEIVKLIMKAYKFATYFDLPDDLQTQESVASWIHLHVDVINMQLPDSVLELDQEERYLSPWVKSQKWAYANIFRLFERYASKSLSRRFTYDGFRDLFVVHIVPEILKMYFKKIELWRMGNHWISDPGMYYLLAFLEQCVTQKPCWKYIEGHVSTIISEVAFPLLCPTDTTLELFENDPQEYIHMILEVFDETNNVQSGVLGLISTLASKRKKATLELILQFAYEKLNSFQSVEETIEVAKQKESALRIVGQIASQLTDSKSALRGQMEPFLKTFILPNFNSRYGFLRARTCGVSSRFDGLEFQDQETLSTLFNGVMNCFNEADNLPVQLEAALGIQAFLSFEQFKDALGSIIVPTMEKLLDISNKIDSDTVSNVIQECVEVYAEQLQPFGSSLMAKLSEQLMRLLQEIHAASNVAPDDYDADDDLTAKNTAALGVFNLMITVLLYFENASEMIAKLEESYAPVIEFVFVNKVEDFYAEAAELIENTTFLVRSVSPTMWKLFEGFIVVLLDTDLSILLDDVVGALRNYIVYGRAEIAGNMQYRDALLQVIYKVLRADPEEDDIGSRDIMQVAGLAQNLILSLSNESASPIVPSLVDDILKCLSINDAAHSGNNSFQTAMVNVIVAGIVISPSSTLSHLISANAIQNFFGIWFNSTAKLTKVFDLKLSVLGFLKLSTLNIAELQSLGLAELVPEFGIKLALLLRALPQAISNLEKSRQEFNGELNFDESNLYGGDGWEDEDEDEAADNEATTEYLNFLEQESSQLYNQSNFFGGDDDDEFNLEEDPFSNTALDNINVFQTFSDTFLGLKNNDTQIYPLLVSNLSEDDRKTFEQTCSLVQ